MLVKGEQLKGEYYMMHYICPICTCHGVWIQNKEVSGSNKLQ